jgi:hypothetical protein
MIRHLRRDSVHPTCEAMINIRGRARQCIWLSCDKDGWFCCRAFGFRADKSGVDGVCIRKGMMVCYDREMLNSKKLGSYNICIYRLLAPVVLSITSVGIKQILDVALRLWGKR